MAWNPALKAIDNDVLYHFGLNTNDHNMKEMFGDVKFVCVGGSTWRMREFASFLQTHLGMGNLPPPENLAASTDRYVLYKVGPVLVANHGIGVPSLSVMLNELLKLLHHADCEDVLLIRIGTSGGLGLDPGTVIISKSAVDGMLSSNFESIILGKKVKRPAVLDKRVANELLQHIRPDDTFEVASGITLCTDDFYEGQGRCDGAFCDYTEDDKMIYLRHLHSQGVRNIEMESLCFAAMCHYAGYKCAVVCVAIVNRFDGDQVTNPPSQLHEWEWHPATLVTRLIKARLGLQH